MEWLRVDSMVIGGEYSFDFFFWVFRLCVLRWWWCVVFRLIVWILWFIMKKCNIYMVENCWEFFIMYVKLWEDFEWFVIVFFVFLFISICFMLWLCLLRWFFGILGECFVVFWFWFIVMIFVDIYFDIVWKYLICGVK